MHNWPHTSIIQMHNWPHTHQMPIKYPWTAYQMSDGHLMDIWWTFDGHVSHWRSERIKQTKKNVSFGPANPLLGQSGRWIWLRRCHNMLYIRLDYIGNAYMLQSRWFCVLGTIEHECWRAVCVFSYLSKPWDEGRPFFYRFELLHINVWNPSNRLSFLSGRCVVSSTTVRH